MDTIESEIPGNEGNVIIGDINGNVESDTIGYEKVYRGYEFEERNRMEKRVFDFAQTFKLADMNI